MLILEVVTALFRPLLVALVLAACSDSPGSSPSPPIPTGPPPTYTYRVVRTHPHDPEAFTQGLVFAGGVLYESTGQYAQSSLRQVELETGEILREHRLEDPFFGEGLALFANRLIQLTWRERTAFVYDAETFAPLGRFAYSTEGWGLTHDGERLIMSDGSSTLYFRDPFTFAETGRLAVRDQQQPVNDLNELEWIEGEIWANVWRTDRIARIDPDSGRVRAWVDLSGLLPAAQRTASTDVLNGIAYDAEGKRLFVTGKWWPRLFEIELVAP